MELEELRDALKIASDREYALVEELLVSVEKKKSAPADPADGEA
ncbi:hypothetical protein [Bacteroides oleiciplenus]|uniref:Uncharacterized protein n=1 Tax=Bacteroides oleiciplenus YIT 12058 TaxID=742727 RepID=K9E021_9BACE|nr:hypothetical protein [Bacteroides oleiciplenus]EKU88891.1 hypothetical protein HMPREF9447_03765 [Bacteroides oleiciplenus YIT 12058]